MNPVIYQCNECEEPIREGEYYYALGGECYCENCVERNRYVAETEKNNNFWEEKF